jgi:hypothetical protein
MGRTASSANTVRRTPAACRSRRAMLSKKPAKIAKENTVNSRPRAKNRRTEPRPSQGKKILRSLFDRVLTMTQLPRHDRAGQSSDEIVHLHERHHD